MKISDFNNNLNFKSIYKFDITRNNRNNARNAAFLLSDIELENSENIIFYDYTDFYEADETGIFEKIHICANDDYDEYIESILRQRNINFTKLSKGKDGALNLDNIYERMILPYDENLKVLATLDTEKIHNLFKENEGFYISEDDCALFDDGFQRFREYLKTGREIEAPQISLDEINGNPVLNFYDGRHRFCVLRDLGLKKMKFTLSHNSYLVADKFNLFI